MIINIDKRLLKKCKDFAAKRVGGSYDIYAFRGESRADKLFEDILIGALGEWGVKKYVESLGHVCNDPDMKIYNKRNKSFDADLKVDEVFVHVKSQGMRSVKRYGNSWLMQASDKLVSSPENDHLFAFTNVNLEDNTVKILGFCWAVDMVYGECKVWSYRTTKVAIYLEDIKNCLVDF